MASSEKDPVCGANIEKSLAVHEKTGQGEVYFCSEDCKNKFIVNPGRYARKT